ncbi:MAG: 6,7-dimethyl-8-ribityllumazine synthase [Magnetococcales bacterium]|nr:6,7-dimethyl-8-ribityllumazine synthase [Magnetococcales bacterium]
MSEASATLEGHLDASGKRFCLIVARFNSFVTEPLLEGALDFLVRHGAARDALTVARVPGAFEIPLAAKRAVESGKFDGVICLGAVIRGATPHFDYVCAEVSKGVAQMSWESGMPVGFGVLTCDTVEQAIDRAGAKSGNKGWETAAAVVEMLDLLPKF